MLPTTPSCLSSKGKTIISKDKESKRFIGRVNSVDKLFCDMITRIKISTNILSDYCNINSPSIDNPFSSSSSCCPVGDKPTKTPKYNYLINVTDLDDDAYELIASLELEACETLRKIREFEKININCNGSSSSQPDSSASISASTSSSEPDGTSSSSSSEPSSSSFPYFYDPGPLEPNSAPTTVFLASYCDLLSLSSELFIRPQSSILHGEFEYMNEPYNIPSSSSSSAPALGRVFLRFILSTSTWEIYAEPHGVIAEMTGSSEINPRGVYTFLYAGCVGDSIFVI